MKLPAEFSTDVILASQKNVITLRLSVRKYKVKILNGKSGALENKISYVNMHYF
jgi:hypothetical protein